MDKGASRAIGNVLPSFARTTNERRVTRRGIMRRSRGWIPIAVLLVLALLFVAWDVMDYAANAHPFQMAPLGQRWFELHRNSLLLIQPAIERHEICTG